MKVSQRGRRATAALASERIILRTDRRATRLASSLLLVCVLSWLTALTVHERPGANWYAAGRFGWSVALLAAVVLIARGVFLGRPVTPRHAVGAAALLSAGIFAHFLSLGAWGNTLVAASGLVLMWPTSAEAQPELLQRVWSLVDATPADPLAPFAMHSLKSYYFNAAATAAIAYRTRLGFAVVSGDPLGDRTQFEKLAIDFAMMCRTRGWRIVVLAGAQRNLGLWTREVIGRAMVAVPIGHDVVVDVPNFTLAGRRYRNVRQAVQRTRNRGVTTQIVDERALNAGLVAELSEVIYASHGGVRTERGFCMNLDGALQGRCPGVQLAIARDSDGQVVAFHRYASAGGGSEISLDAPYRRPDAPNGIDERLSVDMINAAKSAHAKRLSLAFAAFPEVFEAADPGLLERLAYRLIHLLDPLIRLESLYRYLRKFHALGERRYVVLCTHHIPSALVVLLSLEFLPRRRRMRPTHHQ